MILKDSVCLTGLQPQGVVAMIVADTVFGKVGREAVVTLVSGGDHVFAGRAIDVRTSGLSVIEQNKIMALLRTQLNTEFDVRLENDHIHIGYDPKL